jgi:hypothetical protein
VDQYDYREELEGIIASLSSPPTPTPPSSPTLAQPKRLASHRALYTLKALLREAWRAIVARGEAEAWVRDVGVRVIKRPGGVGEVGFDNGINELNSGARSISWERNLQKRSGWILCGAF